MKAVNLMPIYNAFLKKYGPQGWWPIINDKTLLCEYHTGAPRNEAGRFEIACGAILTQSAQWYPNVVRALQQLKLGRAFTKEELALVQQAERLHYELFMGKGLKVDSPNLRKNKGGNIADIRLGKISGKPLLITDDKILTQNTSWNNVVKALLNLKKSNALSAEGMKRLSIGKLRELIKPAGYYNQKAKKLKLFVAFYLKLAGKTPMREELLAVWGIGKETADSILLYAYNFPIFVIDAYTRRMFGYDKKEDYDKIRAKFENALPKNYKIYQEFHALIVEHGKRLKANQSGLTDFGGIR